MTPLYRNDLIRSAMVNFEPAPLSKFELKEQTGIAQETLRKVWEGEPNVLVSTLKKIADHLKIPFHKLFEPREEETA